MLMPAAPAPARPGTYRMAENTVPAHARGGAEAGEGISGFGSVSRTPPERFEHQRGGIRYAARGVVRVGQLQKSGLAPVSGAVTAT